MSSASMPASSSARTASGQGPPCGRATGALEQPPVLGRPRRHPLARAAAAASASPVRRRARRRRSGRRRPRPSARRACPPRPPGRRRSPRSGRPAGPPPPGTAWSAGRWCRRPTSDAHRAPHLGPAPRVEPGRRLVQEEHPGVDDQARGQVEPAPHAAAVLLDRLAAGVGEPEPLQQLVGPLARPAGPRWYSRPNISRFCRPLSSSSTAACWPSSPIRRRTSAGLRTHVEAGDLGPAPSCRSSVDSIRTAVVLPAPLGPSTPCTTPLRNGQVQPVQGRFGAVVLVQSFDDDRMIAVRHDISSRL